ncbi:hypothetical protein F4802DRAFT_619071 [Xylaria palmicola]|nr:hypothetical protein F4802DRAFT_619071 [Xylaria palmicola]
MGSLTKDVRYPDASDPSLVLAHPTAAEKEQTWRLNHREWGGALDLPAYRERELFLASTALAADGGMVHWILTEPPRPGERRGVLASCETLRKRVLYAPPPPPSPGAEATVREGLSYGIGSVYTYPEFRGHKYAARMLGELGAVLRTWPEEEEERLRRKRSPHEMRAKEAVCSALWSDIGKRFYASKGWPVFESTHVEFPAPSSSAPAPGVPPLTLTPVNEGNLAQLCRKDESLLRADLTRHARETGRTAFAFAPDRDVFRWHWGREDFIASHVFPGRPASELRGVARMWAIWTRNYGADAASSPDKNTLYILRLVIDDGGGGGGGGATPAALRRAFGAIMDSALEAARASHCGTVHLWNPDSVVKNLIAECGLAHRFVDRDLDSIPSMMWYGPNEDNEPVDWIANEKYCWC